MRVLEDGMAEYLFERLTLGDNENRKSDLN
jgi:hypothetical protein